MHINRSIRDYFFYLSYIFIYTRATIWSLDIKGLTKQQLRILEFTYRFRHVSTKQLQTELGKHHLSQIQPLLNLLREKHCIGRNFSGEHIRNNRPASYYLLPQGIQRLKQHAKGLDPKALHRLRYDKTASERFVAHNLRLGDTYCAFRQLYGSEMEFTTKTELRGYDYLPQTSPDAWVIISNHDYFLYLIDAATPFFVWKRIIKEYVEYVEDGAWEEAVGSALPTMLLVCENSILRSRLTAFVSSLLASSYAEGISVVTTTHELLTPRSKAVIWEAVRAEG